MVNLAQMNQSHDDLMQKLAKYEDLRIKNEMQGLTSMVKNACRRMSYDYMLLLTRQHGESAMRLNLQIRLNTIAN